MSEIHQSIFHSAEVRAHVLHHCYLVIKMVHDQVGSLFGSNKLKHCKCETKFCVRKITVDNISTFDLEIAASKWSWWKCAETASTYQSDVQRQYWQIQEWQVLRCTDAIPTWRWSNKQSPLVKRLNSPLESTERLRNVDINIHNQIYNNSPNSMQQVLVRLDICSKRSNKRVISPWWWSTQYLR